MNIGMEMLREELREIGAGAQDGLHSLRTRAYRAIMIASAAGQIEPCQARQWALEWAAACNGRLSAKAVPAAASKVKVWIMAGKSEPAVHSLATLDMIASAQPGLASRYSEKATTALRMALKVGREMTRDECLAVLAGSSVSLAQRCNASQGCNGVATPAGATRPAIA
jgi:hypothetical protein